MNILLEDTKEEILKKTEISYEYIAGVFDADGDISLTLDTRHNHIRLQMKFTNADLNLLKQINKKFNNIGTYECKKSTILDPNRNISYSLRYTGKKGIEVISKIYKFSLHVKKKKRMKMVLDNLEVFNNNGRPYTQEQIKIQKEIMEQSRKIIFRGPGAYPPENQLLKDRKKTIFNFTKEFEKVETTFIDNKELT